MPFLSVDLTGTSEAISWQINEIALDFTACGREAEVVYISRATRILRHFYEALVAEQRADKTAFPDIRPSDKSKLRFFIFWKLVI